MGRRMLRRVGNGSIAIAGDDDRHEARCFADEVVVDFPSIMPAIERIRRAFVDEERGAAVHASLHLTRGEAITGGVVPLDVPVRCTCRECGGRGELWMAGCGRCHGSGSELLPHQVEVSVPAGVSDGTRFRFTLTPGHHPPTRVELSVHVA